MIKTENASGGAAGRRDRRLLVAVLLVLGGVVLQTLTLFWNHPLSFLAFLTTGVPLSAAGIVAYLALIFSSKKEVS
jgi:hypothetical protein